MPLTSTGYEAVRAAEFLTTVQNAIVAALTALGLPSDVDFERDTVWGQVAILMADFLGSLSEEALDVYTSRDPASATGVALAAICAVLGITRREATASTATITCTGSPGTAVGGTIVRGGGADGGATWTLDTGTIGGGGTVDVVATCTATGATVAGINAIDEIVTPIAGLTSVTNAAAATPGLDREMDADLSLRRVQSLQRTGRSCGALRSTLMELDGVQAAVVVDNPSDAAVTTGGIALDAHSVACIVYPSTLTAAQKTAVVTAIDGFLTFGGKTMGGQSGSVLGIDGTTRTINYDFAADVTVNVTGITLIMESGYVAADVAPDIQTAFEAYIAALAAVVGGGGIRVSMLDIFGLIAATPGVRGVTSYATIQINGSGSDLLLNLDERPAAGTITVA